MQTLCAGRLKAPRTNSVVAREVRGRAEAIWHMTLIVTVNGRESIWMCADRRLSIAGRPLREDGCKLMILEESDGLALLGYAGLGATGVGTELSDWTSAVLRGRDLTIEEALTLLAGAMRQQLPRHMVRMPGVGGPTHAVIASALVDGEVRMYMIELVFTPDRRKYRFRFVRLVTDESVGEVRMRTQRFAAAGSGARYLLKRNKRWRRDFLRVIRASDRGKVSPQAVADRLAALNLSVSEEDQGVGPRCIVVWRNRRGGVHRGGGGDCCYIGAERDPSGAGVPLISGGTDIRAFLRALLKWQRNPAGGPVEEDLGQKPPDERLR